MSSIFKNSIAILGFVLIVLLGYYLYVVKGDSVITSNDTLISNQADAETQEFLRRLNELEDIKLNKDILNDKRMTSLIDYSTIVPSVPVGRNNPFEPVN